MIEPLVEIGILIIKEALLSTPNLPGVYRMLDKNGKALYVGKAKDLAKRINSYTQISRLCQRMQKAISQTNKLEIITTNTEAQALILEANLIKSLKPKYNVLLKDDKSMPYILLREDHNFAQLVKFRGARTIKGIYFGPFASSRIVKDTIEFLEKTFLLRNCSDSFFSNRKNACMQYQLKRCSAPCVGKISSLDYANNVKQALAFLQGKNLTLQRELSLNMQRSSDLMKYEEAAKYRDQLRSLNYIQNKNTNLFNLEDADVIGIVKDGNLACLQIFLFRNGQNYGNRCIFFDQVIDEEIEKILSIFLLQFYQNNQSPKETIVNLPPEEMDLLSEALGIKIIIPKAGDKLKAVQFATDNAKTAINRKYSEKSRNKLLLEQVQQLFDIKNPIERIEIYDNSHIMGSHAVGAMVVAGPNGFNKKSYRKYNINSTKIGDDYSMLQEVLTRRLNNLTEKPDLLLIDGGGGHLNIASQVLEKLSLDIPLVCISKGKDRNAGKELFHQINKTPFTLDNTLPIMHYLQTLRDEAHRFAITEHRKKRSQAINFSILNQIPGIGPKRRKALINHFTSMKEIEEASIEQLSKLEGINQKIAVDIFKYFHS
jgi:excinuclease ABC subunit C